MERICGVFVFLFYNEWVLLLKTSDRHEIKGKAFNYRHAITFQMKMPVENALKIP